MNKYAVFINSDAPEVREFALRHAGSSGDAREKAIRLYYAVRDAIRYDMTTFGLDVEPYKASNCLQAESAFCVPKAIALAAVCRAAGVPARIGFADVRNHITSPRFAALMDDDLFRWHAYTSIQLDGRWVKATPAFDLALCEKHGVKPLEFDGREDSIFHEFDARGRRHMEYVRFLGEYDDLPYDVYAAEMRAAYPRMLAHLDGERARRAPVR
jgi:transglutaminase-like putative cysteine protease